MYFFRKIRSTRGFTIIELMITIAIVAVLVGLAVPAYNDYTIRAKIAECINGAAVAKLGISEYQQTLGAWPLTLAEAGLDESNISHYCTGLRNYSAATGAFAIDVNEAAIDAAALSGIVIEPVLVPTSTTSGFIRWNCTQGATPSGYLKYLPSTCRDS